MIPAMLKERFNRTQVKRTVQKCFKGFSVLDISIYIIVLTILMIVGLGAYSSLQSSAKRATTRDEMNTLAQACVQYQSDSLSGALPTDLGKLITGLTAGQSVDGIAKGPYVTKTGWTSDPTTFKDGWGNAYTYDSVNRTITSSNNGGTAIVKSF